MIGRNLRQFDNYANCRFEVDPNFDQTLMKVIRPNVGTRKTLYYVEGVLTERECDRLIELTEPHYKSLIDDYSISEREGDRVFTMDEGFAATLFDRLKDAIQDDDKAIRPNGFGVTGSWALLRMNNCFRYLRYVAPSIGFRPHRDATYIENEITRSICSILVYLNDGFEGGDTVFYKTNTKREKHQIVAEEMAGGFVELFRYRPKKGSVLIFNHNMIHMGEHIMNGTKYVIRSDIVYHCTRDAGYNYSWLQHPDYLEAVKLYREAINQELDGHLDRASILYQRGLALRQCHKEL